MAKERKSLYEDMTFQDAYYANQIIAENTEKLEKGKNAILIAWIGTACSVLGFILAFLNLGTAAEIFFFAAFVVAIVAYVMGGGFGTAVKIAGKIGKVAWFIIPYFPVDIFVGLFGFMFAVYAFFFLPIIFIHVHRKQLAREIEDAQEYLQYVNNMNMQYQNQMPYQNQGQVQYQNQMPYQNQGQVQYQNQMPYQNQGQVQYQDPNQPPYQG